MHIAEKSLRVPVHLPCSIDGQDGHWRGGLRSYRIDPPSKNGYIMYAHVISIFYNTYIYIYITNIWHVCTLGQIFRHSLYSAPHYPNIPTTTMSTKHQQMYLQLWQRHQQVLLSSVQGIPKDIAMAVEGQPILTSHVEPKTLGTLKSEHSGKNPNSYRFCGVDLRVLTNRTSKEVSLKHVSLESEVDLKFVSIQAFQLS